MSTTARMALGVLLCSAHHRSLITYTVLGNLIGLPTGTKEIGEVLDEVADYTYEQFGIVLPAIVVTRQDGLPGGRRSDMRSGFWAWTDKHTELSNKWPDDRSLVMELQRRVFLKVEGTERLHHSY
jgi:hypothetical protein